jgi:hypothetical protein
VRLPIWFILLVCGGVIAIGLIGLPLYLFLPWGTIFGPGGVTDQLLNIFTYGLFVLFIILPMALAGLALVWQPDRTGSNAASGPAARYRIWKLAIGLLLVWAAWMLVQEMWASTPPFPG